VYRSTWTIYVSQSISVSVFHIVIEIQKAWSGLTWNKVYDELGKQCIPEDHNAAQTPEIAFVQEQGTEELVSRAEETGGSNVRWIGHLQPSGGTLVTTSQTWTLPLNSKLKQVCCTLLTRERVNLNLFELQPCLTSYHCKIHFSVYKSESSKGHIRLHNLQHANMHRKCIQNKQEFGWDNNQDERDWSKAEAAVEWIQ